MPISTLLHDLPVQRLRGLQFLALSDQAEIERRTATSDDGGGAAWAWNTIGTAPCRLYPVTSRGLGAFVGGALDEHTTHFCEMPAGTDVDTADRIAITGRGTFDVTIVPVRTDELTRRIEVMSQP